MMLYFHSFFCKIHMLIAYSQICANVDNHMILDCAFLHFILADLKLICYDINTTH